MPLIIADYDEGWPILYERERAAILRAICDHIIALEHIGSTSVAGLGAKPIVDIMGGLRHLDDAGECVEPLRPVGYEFVPEMAARLLDDRFFIKRAGTDELVHLHLAEYAGTFWREKLLFRDYLRAHPAEARSYERLKRQLAPLHNEGATYSEAKTEFIRAALARAEAAGT